MTQLRLRTKRGVTGFRFRVKAKDWFACMKRYLTHSITLGRYVHWTLHDHSHFEIPSKDGPPKDKEQVFHKSDMFSIPSTTKIGKNINLQTSPKLKMKVGVWDLINLHMPQSWGFLEKKFVLKHWHFQAPLNPKNPTWTSLLFWVLV